MLVKYLRNGSGQRVGAVVAVGPGQVGWSICRKGQKYNQESALDIAVVRAKMLFGAIGEPTRKDITTNISVELDKMFVRSLKYFK